MSVSCMVYGAVLDGAYKDLYLFTWDIQISEKCLTSMNEY